MWSDHVAAQLPRDLSDLWRGTRAPAGNVVTAESTARQQVLAEIAASAPLPHGITARDAFSSVMCAFSQRLSGGEARDVLLGLPHAVRPLIERCIMHRDEHAAAFDRDQLVQRISDELGATPPAAERIVLAVLGAVKRVLPAKEIGDVASQLPADLRATWRAA